MKPIVPPFLLLCTLLAPPVVGQEIAPKPKVDVQDSVVRVTARLQVPDFSAPWIPQPAHRVSGSGVVIDGNRILTSAHLVTYAAEVLVQPTSGRQHATSVEALAPDLDLALLHVKDPQFFNNRPSVKLAANLPKIGESLQIYGFPQGGAAMRPSNVNVSRIEYGLYEYNGMGLRIAVTGAVGPGRSGGPAVNEQGQMVGVVCSASILGQNVGYLIPTEETRTFLEDVQDGDYNGTPRMWIDFQKLENPALRAKLELPENITGVMVRGSHRPTKDYPLQRRDGITKIGNHKIDNDGMAYLADKDLRVFFTYVAPQLAKNGKVPLSVIRDGAEQRIEAPVAAQWDFLVPSLRGEQPSYFIWGPLALAPATEELVDSLAPVLTPLWSVRQSPLLTRRHDFRQFPEEELVVATMLYPHETSRGYSTTVGQVVSHVNGTPVRNLRHLVELLRQANVTQDEFVVFRFADRFSDTLVFDRAQVMNVADTILRENRVFSRGSEDLLHVWNAEARR